jgi:PhnB protein
LGKAMALSRYGLDGAPTPPKALRGKVMHARLQPVVLFHVIDSHDAQPMNLLKPSEFGGSESC